ncbi:MAG: chorismate synthase [Flavobacteriales bacterium CG_4_10_14_0_2_um_filter_32_8]|nr:MAG: chorismate synthase [Flavobacteriales bacterium CG_4_10_14_0_2_um_filter_32_8]
MAGNSIGKIFQLTTFGESHGTAIGGVVDGCPAGLKLDISFIQEELDKRKPGQSLLTTQRKEEDVVEILSGVFEGITTGTPIGFIIKNNNSKSADYEHIKDKFRPSHADYTYETKYGLRDYRGGGRSSARETACRVVGGAIAKLVLQHYGIQINGYVSQVGEIKLLKHYSELDFSKTYSNAVRCPDENLVEMMINYIDKIRKDGDTIGGMVSCVVSKLPVGLGEPVFDRLEADLAKAMLSINATKGFEIGAGFGSITKKGSELNDEFFCHAEPVEASKKIGTRTNNSGGVQGGISNGEDLFFNVAFKPIATIMQKQKTVNKDLQEVEIEGKGRHDSCVLPRAVVIVEGMAALVVVDHLLRNRTVRLEIRD